MTDTIRLVEKLRINEEIRMNTIYNDADRTTLLRLRGMNSSELYVQTQMKKVTESLNTRVQELTDLEERIEKLENGDLDEELIIAMEETAREIKEKGDLTITRKREAKAVSAADAKKSLDFYKQERQSMRMNKERYYKSAENHFHRTCDTIPDFMERDLKRLPSNHGFCLRGVYLFGPRAPTSKVDFKVTELQKGKQIITYWNKTHISIYEKVGRKGNETLLSRTIRKKV
jgi:hypothetical protein